MNKKYIFTYNNYNYNIDLSTVGDQVSVQARRGTKVA